MNVGRLGRLFLVLVAVLPLAPNVVMGERLGSLQVVTISGHYQFVIEVADSETERARGLMFRRQLAKNAGMLFDYGKEQKISMWMKNTFIALDMIFISAAGRVISIAQDTVPHSLRPISSDRPARAVLEVNAGTADQLQIRIGDRVWHQIFEE
mgnify:CR=1 FL=1